MNEQITALVRAAVRQTAPGLAAEYKSKWWKTPAGIAARKRTMDTAAYLERRPSA